MVVRSVPGAVATGLQSGRISTVAWVDPVATAPGTDSIIVVELYRHTLAALQKSTVSGFALELAVVDYNLAA